MIRLLWESDGPVDFEGSSFNLHHARMDTEPYEGRFPKIWVGASGRACSTSPAAMPTAGGRRRYSPEDYAAKLKIIRESAERAGRDPMAIVPAFIVTCLIGDDAELAEILDAPLVKALVLQFSAEVIAPVRLRTSARRRLARLSRHRSRVS